MAVPNHIPTTQLLNFHILTQLITRINLRDTRGLDSFLNFWPVTALDLIQTTSFTLLNPFYIWKHTVEKSQRDLIHTTKLLNFHILTQPMTRINSHDTRGLRFLTKFLTRGSSGPHPNHSFSIIDSLLHSKTHSGEKSNKYHPHHSLHIIESLLPYTLTQLIIGIIDSTHPWLSTRVNSKDTRWLNHQINHSNHTTSSYEKIKLYYRSWLNSH